MFSAPPSPFRQAALDRLSSPEQLDELMEVAPPRAWLALAAVGVVLLAALVWGIFGRIPTKVHADGIFIRGQHLFKVTAFQPGYLAELKVGAGDVVAEGQVVAQLRRVGGSNAEALLPVTAVRAGRVLEVLAKPGDVISAGKSLLNLEPVEGEIEAILYLDASQGRRLAPGMAVQISPSQYPKSEFGYLVGRVKSVSDFPASPEAMHNVLENDDLVRRLSGRGAPIALYASLSPIAGEAGHYRWSSSAGPSGELRSGSLCSASIVIEERRPLSLVVPAFDRLFAR